MKDNDNAISSAFREYQVYAQIARKVSSRVYLAQLPNSAAEQRLVIKVLEFMYLQSQHEQNTFLQEATALAQLKHSSILPIVDVGIEKNLPYFVTEYAPNGSLYDRLKREAAFLLPLPEFLRILSQIGQALQYAHNHAIVHGNVKPENILFNTNDEALLTDFNLPSMHTISMPTHSLDIRSANYMAPEQFSGRADKKSDQYALACIAYELLTGRVPFPAMACSTVRMKHATETPLSPRRFNPYLPEHVERAVLKAMEKDPEHRYASVLDFVTALNTVPQTPKAAAASSGATVSTVADAALSASPSVVPLARAIPDAVPFETTALQQGIQIKNNREDALINRRIGVGYQPRKRSARETWFAIVMACLVIFATLGLLRFFTLAHTPNPSQKLNPASSTTVRVTPTVQLRPTSPSPTAAPQSSPTPGSSAVTPTPTTAPQPRSMLTVSLSAPLANVNLTNEGSRDWIHWGLNRSTETDRKNGVAPQFGTYTVIGNAAAQPYNNNPGGYTWYDGTPTTVVRYTPTGVFVLGTNNGFLLSLPASTTLTTVRVYVGVFQTQGTFNASLSDGSVPAYVDASLNNANDILGGVYTITYRSAANNGQHLTITFINSNNNYGGVTLQAVTMR